MKILEDLISYLDHETGTYKVENPLIITIEQSEFIGSYGDFYIFRIHSKKPHQLRDSTRAILDTKDQQLNCIIISSKNQDIYIAVHSQNRPNIKNSFVIKIDKLLSMKILRKELKSFRGNKIGGIGQKIIQKDIAPKIITSTKSWDSTQNSNFLKHRFTVIEKENSGEWNKFLSLILRQHLENDNKILFLSMSNGRIDSILMNLKELKNFRKKEKIRYGIPDVNYIQPLKTKFYLLLPDLPFFSNKANTGDNVFKKSSSSRDKKQDQNQADKTRGEIRSKLSELIRKKSSVQQKMADGNRELNQLQDKLKEIRKANPLKKLLISSDPKKLERMINKKNREVERLQLRLNGIQNATQKLGAELEKFDKEKVGKKQPSDKGDSQINNIRNEDQKTLQEASLIATTIPNSYLAPELSEIKFDTIIVDSINNCHPAEIYYFLNLPKKHIVFLADNTIPKYSTGNDNQQFEEIEGILSLLKFNRNQEEIEEREETQSMKDRDFQDIFYKDLENMQEEMLIISPNLAPDKIENIQPLLKVLRNHQITISVITRPPNQQPANLAPYTVNCIKALKFYNIKVKFLSDIEESIVLLDQKLVWRGGVNILGKSVDSPEMERSQDKELISKIKKRYQIKALFEDHVLMGKRCPDCETRGIDNYILIATKEDRPQENFYRCSGYPSCQWQSDIKAKKRVPSDNLPGYQLGIFDSPGKKKKNKQWESKERYWSSTRKKDYLYSPEQDAWFREKRDN